MERAPLAAAEVVADADQGAVRVEQARESAGEETPEMKLDQAEE